MNRLLSAALAVALAAPVVPLTETAAQAADGVRDRQWHLRALRVTEAHRISQGEGVVVAVIDSGVDPHPDLRANLLPGKDVYPGGTGNGQRDGDPNRHGTRMAGLIAANGSALGIAPQARILPIRDIKSGTKGDSDDMARAIEWAVDSGAKVINISAGAGSTPSLRAAVTQAMASDVVVVAAVGNRSQDLLVPFPAAYEGVVAVGATDRDGKQAQLSVTSPKVSVVAPGVDMYSTGRRGSYGAADGSSSSTAIVSGAVALIRSKYPDLPATEVVHRLTATAVDKGPPGRDDEYGYGAIDLVAALTAEVPPLAGGPAPAASTPVDPGASSAAADPAPNPEGTFRLALVVGIGFVVLLLLLVGGFAVWIVLRALR